MLAYIKWANWRHQTIFVHTRMRTRKPRRRQRAFPHTQTNAQKWRQLMTFHHSSRRVNIEGTSGLSLTHTRKHEGSKNRFSTCLHRQTFRQLRAFPYTVSKVKAAKRFSAYVHRQTLRQQGSLPYTYSRKNEGNKERSTHTHVHAKITTANNFPEHTFTR